MIDCGDLRASCGGMFEFLRMVLIYPLSTRLRQSHGVALGRRPPSSLPASGSLKETLFPVGATMVSEHRVCVLGFLRVKEAALCSLCPLVRVQGSHAKRILRLN